MVLLSTVANCSLFISRGIHWTSIKVIRIALAQLWRWGCSIACHAFTCSCGTCLLVKETFLPSLWFIGLLLFILLCARLGIYSTLICRWNSAACSGTSSERCLFVAKYLANVCLYGAAPPFLPPFVCLNLLDCEVWAHVGFCVCVCVLPRGFSYGELLRMWSHAFLADN